MSVFAAVSVGGCVATLVSSIRMVVKHQAPVRPILKWVVPAALATLLITPIAVTAVPILGVTLACLPGYLAYRGARRYATLTYPRRVTATLLESRLKPVIGDPWTGQALLIEYDPTNSADRANVAKVVIKIPRAVLPSKIVDRCKEVLTETFSGGKKKKWKASTADTVITFTPKVEIQDPPPLKHLKSVLQDNRALGADARVEVNEWDDVGEIAAFTGKASKELANVVASRIRQVHIEDLVHTRVPIANGSWVVTWDVTGVPTITARRSAFRDIIYKEPPERFIQSRAQAAEEYPNALFRVGLHPDGRVCTRTPIKEPNGLTTGATGKGKTTYLHNQLIDAAAWGFIIIIVDGKCSDSYIGFRDWPGVQIVANDLLTAIRTIFYVAEMLSRRQDGGRCGDFPIDDNIPVLFIVDEYADLVTRLQTEVWSIYKAKDKELPPTCPAITILERLPQMIRQFRIHMETGTQKPDSQRISQNIIFNSDKKSQWGEMTGAQSQSYWGDYNTGPSVPPIAGRGIIKTIDGKPEAVQGYFVPDPLKVKTREHYELLAQMMPPQNLHRRIVFDIPDPDTASWDDIATAPWYFAEDRPHLDPLSPQYDPPAFIKYNTFGNLNPATLDIDEPQTNPHNGHSVTELDERRKG